MIIDCHGHYTTAPKALENWRTRQIAGIKDPAVTPNVGDLKILSAADKDKVYEGNARRVFPRLDATLKAKGR